MKTKGGIGRRLARAFLLPALAISVTAALGVWVAGFTIEETLIKRALKQEAGHFWAAKAEQPDLPAPNTANLTGYLAANDADAHFPTMLRGLEEGFHPLTSSADLSVAYVTARGDDRLALVFDGERVRELSVFFGLVPLGLVLAVLYVSAWLAYRAARRAVSPVEWLAREVRRLDPADLNAGAFAVSRLPRGSEVEVVELADALTNLAQRVEAFAERERNFTRDASHELRSPLTVIRLAADMLLSEQELEHAARNSALRIKRAANDIEELTEAFFLLARESERGLAIGSVCINDIVVEEVQRARLLADERSLEIVLDAPYRLELEASAQVLSVIIGNLLRNAVTYTERGEIIARVGDSYVEIADSGVGIARDELPNVFQPFYRGSQPAKHPGPGDVCARPVTGQGVGLTIVKRLTDRFAWPVRIDSAPGAGTRVVVEFPDARCEKEASGDAD